MGSFTSVWEGTSAPLCGQRSAAVRRGALIALEPAGRSCGHASKTSRLVLLAIAVAAGAKQRRGFASNALVPNSVGPLAHSPRILGHVFVGTPARGSSSSRGLKAVQLPIGGEGCPSQPEHSDHSATSHPHGATNRQEDGAKGGHRETVRSYTNGL